MDNDLKDAIKEVLDAIDALKRGEENHGIGQAKDFSPAKYMDKASEKMRGLMKGKE